MDTDTAKTQVAGVVDSAREKTQAQAEQAVEKGRGVLRTQVDSRSTQAGQQAQSVAEALRQTATQLRGSGDEQKVRYAGIADQGAERLDRAGGYLADSDAEELLSKVEDVARQQPWLVAGAGLFLGIAAARFLKASSNERYYQRRPAYGRQATSWAPTRALTEPGISESPVLAAPTV
jgi:hypothetical protein